MLGQDFNVLGGCTAERLAVPFRCSEGDVSGFKVLGAINCLTNIAFNLRRIKRYSSLREVVVAHQVVRRPQDCDSVVFNHAVFLGSFEIEFFV